MRFGISTAAAVCVLGAGLAVSGCTPSSSSSPVASAGPSTRSANAASTTPSAQAAGNGGTCQAQNLGLALGAKTGTSAQVTQAVDLTNHGSSGCTMDGFPGVDLVGAANGQQDFTWSLERQSARYSKVALPPGGTAHFDLIYLPSTPGDGIDITVAKMVITPPDDFTQAEVTWNQSVLLQDGATHPGTYITPVASGS